jgi:uncharacterized phage infection (PIP) family protein YhgE
MPKLEVDKMPKDIKIDTSSMPKPEGMMDMVKSIMPSSLTNMFSATKEEKGPIFKQEDLNKPKEVTKTIAQPPKAPDFDKSKFKMPDMGQLTIGPDGMPKISAKPQAETIPAATKPIEKKTETPKPVETKPTDATSNKETADKRTGTTKEASQDDMAKLLTSLNTTMNKVYNSIEGMSSKLSQQVKATKAMSGNAHDRT